MNQYVYDSSALLAILLDEPGADIAAANIADAMMSTVNVAEIYSRVADKGIPVEKAERFLVGKGVRFVDFDAELARAAGAMRAETRNYGLSIGDRACIALAIRENATVLTADSIWTKLNLPCQIELIR